MKCPLAGRSRIKHHPEVKSGCFPVSTSERICACSRDTVVSVSANTTSLRRRAKRAARRAKDPLCVINGSSQELDVPRNRILRNQPRLRIRTDMAWLIE